MSGADCGQKSAKFGRTLKHANKSQVNVVTRPDEDSFFRAIEEPSTHVGPFAHGSSTLQHHGNNMRTRDESA